MTTDLEPRIRDLFRDLADQTTITPDVLPTSASAGTMRGNRNRWIYACAAAATVGLIVAAVFVRFNRDAVGSAPSEEYGDPVGIFPAGDAERVAAVGYSDPTQLAIAYLADRFPSSSVTDESVARIDEPILERGGRRAVVRFSFGDELERRLFGQLVVESVHNAESAEAWVVVAALAGGADVDEISFTQSDLVVDLADGASTGNTTISDAFTNEEIDAWTSNEFAIEDLSTRGVIVRFISIAGGEATTSGQLMEVLVRQGERRARPVTEDIDDLVEAEDHGPFAGDVNTTIDSIRGRRPVATVEGTTIEIHDGTWAGTDNADQPRQFCIDTTFRRGGRASCWEDDGTIPGLVTMLVPANGHHSVVIGVVPDRVTSVTGPSGRSIPIEENVWYDVVELGTHTYVIATADGSTSQTLTFASVIIGVAPG